MRPVVIDFETYFDKNYSLKKLSTEAYIRSSQFEAHGAAIKWGPDEPAQWYTAETLRLGLPTVDWSDAFIICHHTHFDGLILSHHYGVRPRMWGDTLSMARLLLGNHVSASLDSVREHFGLPAKTTPYNLFKGKHWHELDHNTQQLIAQGACDEVESIWRIFGELAKGFPLEEYQVIDTTVRMFVEPVLKADTGLLARIWQNENDTKAARMATLGVTEEQLQSADKFANLLRQVGVDPELKPGKPNGDGSEKLIYAFAKTDSFMESLLNDEDDDIRMLAEARLGAKSTIVQTRAATLGWMASRGDMCVYLAPYAAHTTRWGGGDGCLTADTEVVIFDFQKGLTIKKIVDILPDDLVWDGEQFVQHDGVAFRGYREVIEYDGVRGTPDHLVFTSLGEITLAKAKQKKARIDRAKAPTKKQVHAARTRSMPINGVRNVAIEPVYDILNCGPRHRFAANGRIVRNSNWQNLKKEDPEYPTRGLNLRDSILPPPGYQLWKPDLSQVEARLLCYVAGQDDATERFRLGADPYVSVASQFYGYTVNKRDHPNERQLGKILTLSCGFGSGGPKIQHTVRVKSRGKILLTDEEGIKARDAYRDTHQHVVALWRSCDRLIARLADKSSLDWQFPGLSLHVRDGQIYLPNGCPMIYIVEYYRDPETGEESWRRKTRRGWMRIYGAALVENCLSGNTKVLTRRGWQYIDAVQKTDVLWDGVAWVTHDGVVHRGVQQTDKLNGVRMTSNHEVLSTDGWVRASRAEGLHRAAVRLPDGVERCGNYGKETLVARSVRLRRAIRACVERSTKTVIVRVQNQGIDCTSSTYSRHVKTSGVCSLAIDDRSMSSTFASGMEKLWCAGHQSLRALAAVRKFLVGHGANISARAYTRTKKQRSWIRAKKLLMGFVPATSEKPQRVTKNQNALGCHDCGRSCTAFGSWGDDSSLSDRQRLANGTVVHPTRFYESTYDVLNCGPRNRFVVLGDSGPFIVHNCIQGLARVLISRAMIRINQLGYRIVSTEHDSLWILVPQDGQEARHRSIIHAEMTRAPEWAPGLPLDCEVH